MRIANAGKLISEVAYTVTNDDSKEEIESKHLAAMDEKKVITIEIPRLNTPIRRIRIRISYQNHLMYHVRKILVVDVEKNSMTEEYNSYLENLEIPEFYVKRGHSAWSP